jgi:3-dehydroquinate synthetase
VRLGDCPAHDAERVDAHLRAVGLPDSGAALPGGPYDASRLVMRMGSDKKNRDGAITLVLARALGEAYIKPGADAGDIAAFLEEDLKTR